MTKWFDFGSLFTPSEKTKLAGIETAATADQTGAEIKTLYEGEADTNAYTDAEKTKLTGIEDSATADQTGAEIKTAYEGEANAYTDTKNTKLAGIATGADVTGSNPPQAHNASVHTDRTRHLYLGAAHHTTGGREMGGIALDPTTDEYVTYPFAVPADFVSIGNIYVYYKADVAAGNVVLDITTYYQITGEVIGAHSESDPTNVIATSTTTSERFTTIGLLASAAISDTGIIKVNRDANHASDTNVGDLVINGVLVEYTADM